MQTYSITLARGDEKKHSVIYKSKDSEMSVSFYVPKLILGAAPYPTHLLVTLEAKP
jgi:hypothetical protein